MTKRKRWQLPVLTLGCSLVLLISACSSNDASYSSDNYGLQPTPDVYTIQRGDTLFSIAWRFGMDQNAIMEKNNIVNPDRILAGQKLILKGTAKEVRSTQTAPTQTVNVVSRNNSDLWVWPVRGAVMKSFNPSSIGGTGMRIKGQSGQTVNAADAGVVVYQGTGLNGYGNVIIIRHTNDLLSAYGFLEQAFVKEGDKVSKRQRIGKVGRINKSEYALHFEVRKNGKPVNPKSYIGNTYHF